MAKLKQTKLHAPRPTVIPGLALPIGPAIGLFYAVLLLGLIFRGWRSWLVLAVITLTVVLTMRVLVRRDHNAFRVVGLWLNTKAFSLDDDVWEGTTLRAFPPRDKWTFRGT